MYTMDGLTSAICILAGILYAYMFVTRDIISKQRYGLQSVVVTTLILISAFTTFKYTGNELFFAAFLLVNTNMIRLYVFATGIPKRYSELLWWTVYLLEFDAIIFLLAQYLPNKPYTFTTFVIAQIGICLWMLLGYHLSYKNLVGTKKVDQLMPGQTLLYKYADGKRQTIALVEYMGRETFAIQVKVLEVIRCDFTECPSVGESLLVHADYLFFDR